MTCNNELSYVSTPTDNLTYNYIRIRVTVWVRIRIRVGVRALIKCAFARRAAHLVKCVD